MHKHVHKYIEFTDTCDRLVEPGGEGTTPHPSNPSPPHIAIVAQSGWVGAGRFKMRSSSCCGMFSCMYTCEYVIMCVYIYTYIHVSMYVYTYDTYIYILVYRNTYVCIYVHTYK